MLTRLQQEFSASTDTKTSPRLSAVLYLQESARTLYRILRYVVNIYTYIYRRVGILSDECNTPVVLYETK